MAKDDKLIKGEDLLVKGEYKAFKLVIERAAIEERENEGGKKTGLLVHFAGAKKPLFAPMDQINWRLIRCELGTVEPTEIIGKTLTLYPVKGDWFGEVNTLAVRVQVNGDKPRPRISRKTMGASVVGLKVES
jgi:hypothetical protein